MKKECDKCKFNISTNNFKRHYKVCDGQGLKKHRLEAKRLQNEKIVHKCNQCDRVFDIGLGLTIHKRFCSRSFEELGWRSKRKYLFEQMNYSCENCGFNKTRDCGSSILEVDHIDGNHKNNERTNLRVLCPNCHALTDNFRNWGRKGQEKSSTRIRKGNKDFEDFQNERITLKNLKDVFNEKFVNIVNEAHESGEIDFSKFGWVGKLSERLNETPMSSGRRLRKLMPEFYDEHCFRRGYSKYKNQLR
ncbi:MAG: HNH endonuclease [Rhodobacteraceae bacterium]|nr:HNH endonuclease [Paracoccaceae bacterium]